ncbi:MAG: hypothetical protein ABI281_10540 [Caldimonas sp.]
MNEERPLQGAGAADDDDFGHDAWLREALRHAPDAAASAPPMLRDAILAEARAAVAAPATAPNGPRAATGAMSRRAREAFVGLGAFWSWLAQPAVAAGFASVMAAMLVGVMWWDRPLDETMPQPSVPAATIGEAMPAKPEAPRPTTPAPTTGTATAAAIASPAAPPRVAQPESRQRARATPPDVEPRRDDAQPFPVQREAERSAVETLASADKTIDAGASTKKPGTDGAPADEKRSTVAPMSVAAVPPAVTAPAPVPAKEQAALGAARDAAGDAANPLASLRAAFATDTRRKARRDVDDQASPDDDAMKRWLGELDAAAAGRWLALDSGAARRGSVVTVRVGGVDAATLWLDGRTITLERHVGGSTPVWRAVLAPAAAERIRQTLPRLPR